MYNKTLRYSYQNTDKDLVFSFELAGKSKEDVKIYNTNNKINIEINDKGVYAIDFDDCLYDLNDYNFEEIRASMLNGLLTLSIPKAKPKSKQIQIE